MAGISLSRAWQTIKPHVPLIKFRKGGLSATESRGIEAASAHAGSSPPAGGKPRQVQSRPVIEDYQLPQRYRRHLIDEKEIAYINRGGPE